MGRPSPRVKVLYAVMDRLKTAGLAAITGEDDLQFRWARNRYATREERPCLSIAFVSDEPADEGRVAHSTDETVMALAVDFIVDLAVETEASAETNTAMGTPLDDFDPSGLERLSWVLDNSMRALRQCFEDPLRDETDLGRKADWIEQAVIDDDEDLPDEDGRLVARANVIYRVHSSDPTVLLERE